MHKTHTCVSCVYYTIYSQEYYHQRFIRLKIQRFHQISPQISPLNPRSDFSSFSSFLLSIYLSIIYNYFHIYVSHVLNSNLVQGFGFYLSEFTPLLLIFSLIHCVFLCAIRVIIIYTCMYMVILWSVWPYYHCLNWVFCCVF